MADKYPNFRALARHERVGIDYGIVARPTVYAGGRDGRLRRQITLALQARGFNVERHTDPDLQGLEPNNLCNRGRSGRGVQLEIARPLRLQMFRSLSREGRKYPTATFRSFVAALREVLAPFAP